MPLAVGKPLAPPRSLSELYAIKRVRVFEGGLESTVVSRRDAATIPLRIATRTRSGLQFLYYVFYTAKH